MTARVPPEDRRTPEERRLLARLAIAERWAKENPTGQAVRGQAGLVAKFIREAYERDPGITDTEAARRGQSAYKAHMLRLALASVKARKAKKKAS